jgi:hypothetical protein
VWKNCRSVRSPQRTQQSGVKVIRRWISNEDSGRFNEQPVLMQNPQHGS